MVIRDNERDVIIRTKKKKKKERKGERLARLRIIWARASIRHSHRVRVPFETLTDLIAGSNFRVHSMVGLSRYFATGNNGFHFEHRSFPASRKAKRSVGPRACRVHFHPASGRLRAGHSYCADQNRFALRSERTRKGTGGLLFWCDARSRLKET